MPSQKEMIEETYKSVNEIKTFLFGVKNSSDKGLISEIQSLKNDYYKFKNKALIIFGIFVGLGLLASGTYGIIQWLG